MKAVSYTHLDVYKRQGLTEVIVTIEGKEIKTLVDTGSEISVILEELRELTKNIPLLPVAGITIVGVTVVTSKRVTKQVQLNMKINRVEYDNTFLVVRVLNLEVILGNDFLKRHRAINNLLVVAQWSKFDRNSLNF